jgi:AraC-like DNA-binding protein
MSSSTPAQYALILIDLAVEAGIAQADLLAGTGLAEDGIAAIGARVPDASFQTLALNARQLSGDPTLGLRLGERLNLGAHAVLGQAFMACRDLGEVMQLFERYYHLLAPDLELEFNRGPERVRIASTDSFADLPLQFGLECIAAAMRNTLSGLLGTNAIPLRFEFPYAEPAHVQTYREVLGDDLHFERPVASWSFPTALLTHQLSSSNLALRRLYEAECARLLADLQDTRDLGAQTRRLLRKFEGQYPQMPQLAAMLNVSPRTYRRRLAEQGSSFQELLDSVRAEHATRYLREGRLSIASIAYQLGFSDPSNFRRAYRRWTGYTPGEVRREAGRISGRNADGNSGRDPGKGRNPFGSDG